MRNLLWLDDLRNPFLNKEDKIPNDIKDWNINWVRDYEEFTDWIKIYGLPDAISFDHDLHPEHYTPEYFWNDYEESKKFQDWKSGSYKFPTGEDCAIFLVNYCRSNNKKLPEIFIHSANPVGVDYIKEILSTFKN